MKKRILITNDDGFFSEGLFFLVKSLSKNYEVTIVAPNIERSGSGSSITLNRSLRIQKEKLREPLSEISCWSVDGTPVDCIKIALSVLLCEEPDFVISGINHGSNAGRNLLYSGTVGACIEAAHRGLPSIAFSCVGQNNCQFSQAASVAPILIEWLDQHPLPRGCFFNVNVPSDEKILGIKFARQGLSYWVEDPQIERLHDGESNYFLGGKYLGLDEKEASDISYLEKGYISVVPVYANELTHLSWLHAHSGLEPKLP
jgi:5'-nucleotidase